MQNSVQLSENYTSVSEAKHIQQAFIPEFKDTGIHYCHYARFYIDNRIEALVSDADSHQEVFASGMVKPLEQLKPGYSFVPTRNQLLCDLLVKHNLGNLFEIITEHPDGSKEVFSFASEIGDDSVVDFYFNNLDRLENYKKIFKDNFPHLIQKVRKNPIILPGQPAEKSEPYSQLSPR